MTKSNGFTPNGRQAVLFEQAVLHISSSRLIAVTSGAKILYTLPGITTLVSTEDLNGSPVHPLPSDSTVEVTLSGVPADLTVAAASPQIPAAGQLDWGYTLGPSRLPLVYRVSGSLASAERTAQRNIFFAGAFLGISGAAVIWLIESLIHLFFRRRH
jgi:hypothetical protein